MANILTISRFLLIPVFLAFIFLRQFTSALIVFVFAGLTDFLDGAIARRFGQITELGKVLDPLVDRLLVASALISLTILERIPLWLFLAIEIRDLAMMLGAVLLRVLKVPAVEITLLGKVSSTLLLLAIALNILRPDLSYPLLYTSLGFSLVSGLDYLYKGASRVTKRGLES